MAEILALHVARVAQLVLRPVHVPLEIVPLDITLLLQVLVARAAPTATLVHLHLCAPFATVVTMLI